MNEPIGFRRRDSTFTSRARRMLRGSALGAWMLLSAGPLGAQIQRRFGMEIPMRDGVRLAADLWMPAGEGPHPVILMRTPYLKTMPLLRFPELGAYFAERGYIVAVQDVRGRGDSEGSFGFFLVDGADGYDSVEWLAAQPWSNGRVCMMGVSYLGTVQWLAARERPPHLECIVPTAAAGFDKVFNYQGGAFLMGWALPWANVVSGRIYQSPNAAGADWDAVFRHRPLLTLDEAFGRRMPLYQRFVKYPDWETHWEPIRFRQADFEAVQIPALHVTGWFDGDQPAALHYWRGMAEHSPARAEQFLLIGPWTHQQTFLGGRAKLGDMEFTDASVVDVRALHLAFFDRYLKGRPAAFEFPRARIFVTGSNRWREFDSYPPSGVEERPLYLHSGGHANSSTGDGTLDWSAPGQEPPDRYTFDPRDPVPAAVEGGGDQLPLDHSAIERRTDVLVYTSASLERRVEVIGSPVLVLHAATDARDTDFTAKILDVYPDGRAIKLGTLPASVVRARFRHGLDREQLLEPGRAERYRIELWDMAHSFEAGHRIRIEISSSAYPFISPNQNTGNALATDIEWKVARQTIFHDVGRPSHVVLPVFRN